MKRCLAKKDKGRREQQIKDKTPSAFITLSFFIDLANCTSAHEHILKHRVKCGDGVFNSWF